MLRDCVDLINEKFRFRSGKEEKVLGIGQILDLGKELFVMIPEAQHPSSFDRTAWADRIHPRPLSELIVGLCSIKVTFELSYFEVAACEGFLSHDFSAQIQREIDYSIFRRGRGLNDCADRVSLMRRCGKVHPSCKKSSRASRNFGKWSRASCRKWAWDSAPMQKGDPWEGGVADRTLLLPHQKILRESWFMCSNIWNRNR
jgi:hypothetical protein